MKNKCQFNTIFKISFAIYSIVFMTRGVTSGLLYFNLLSNIDDPQDNLETRRKNLLIILTINSIFGELIKSIYMLAVFKMQQIYVKIMNLKQFSESAQTKSKFELRSKLFRQPMSTKCMYCYTLAYNFICLVFILTRFLSKKE